MWRSGSSSIGIHVALIDGGNKHIFAPAMAALNAIDNDDFLAFSVPLGITLFGAAGATFTAGALPKWMGWVALILGVVFFTPAGFLAFALTGIWIIAASIVIRRGTDAPAAVAGSAA